MLVLLIRVAGVEEDEAAAEEFESDVDPREDIDEAEEDDDTDLEDLLDASDTSVLSATIESCSLKFWSVFDYSNI